MKALETLLSRLGELERRATPRPWRWLNYSIIADHGRRPVVLGSSGDWEGGSTLVECRDGLLEDLLTEGPNARLLTEARNALPVLLEILKVQGEALKHYANPDSYYAHYSEVATVRRSSQYEDTETKEQNGRLFISAGKFAREALATAEKLAQGLESGK